MKKTNRLSTHTPATTAHAGPTSADTAAAPAITDAPRREPRAAAAPDARMARRGEPKDQIVSKYLANTMDRAVDAAIGRLTFGIAPVASAMDVLDWMGHLAVSPGKQARLFEKAVRKAGRFWWYAARSLGGPGTYVFEK